MQCLGENDKGSGIITTEVEIKNLIPFTLNLEL